MKNSKSFFILIMATAFFLGACAKTDSEFAEKYQQNAMDADVIDGQATQEAAEQAEAQNLSADVVDIKRVVSGATQTITSMILVNNTQVPVTTTHIGTSLAVAQGSLEVSGFTVVFQGVCSNSSCTMYYANLAIYKNNKLVIQEGVRRVFTDSSLDTYQWLTPEARIPLVANEKSLTASDLTNEKVMVGKLNTKNSGAGAGSASGTRF